MAKEISKSQKLHLRVWLALALFLLLNCIIQSALGATYNLMRVQSYASCTLPSIILRNGTDNVSFVYESQTSAIITINATFEFATYSYTLNIDNNASEDCEVQLELYEAINISRISNMTITLHDNNSPSDQIIISNGSIAQSNGSFYTLSASSTIYVKVKDLKQTQEGNSYLHVYLKTRLVDTSVYTLYLVTFKLT